MVVGAIAGAGIGLGVGVLEFRSPVHALIGVVLGGAGGAVLGLFATT
jgi:hypothetical protein